MSEAADRGETVTARAKQERKVGRRIDFFFPAPAASEKERVLGASHLNEVERVMYVTT
jgi:hypothetical protein